MTISFHECVKNQTPIAEDCVDSDQQSLALKRRKSIHVGPETQRKKQSHEVGCI